MIYAVNMEKKLSLNHYKAHYLVFPWGQNDSLTQLVGEQTAPPNAGAALWGFMVVLSNVYK